MVLGSVDREDVQSKRVRRQHSPLSLLCITMILRVHRKISEITAFHNSGIRARFMRRCYMHE